ncbi:MAG: hypothetical protein ABI051_17390 [Vicinamibacterales bacterium]
MRRSARVFGLTSTVVVTMWAAAVGAQQVETRAAFDGYVRVTDARSARVSGDAAQFLWIDALPAERRAGVLAALRQGEVVTAQGGPREDGASIAVSGGLIHHWVGTVFVPGATLGQTVALLQDYNRHAEIYQPIITRAQLLSHDADDFTFTMRFTVRKVLSVVLDTDQHARFQRPAADRAASRIVSTRIAEVESAGTSTEREKSPGQDRGYLWGLVSYWRFVGRDNGTYVECESVSLSRPLPTGLGWLFGKAASAVPKDIIVANLAATRRALTR